MPWPQTPYFLPLLITAAISLALTGYAWKRRTTPAALLLALLMLAITIWTTGYAFEIAGTTLRVKLFWASVQYGGIAFVSLIYFLFAIQFTGSRKQLIQPTWAKIILGLVPTITLLLAWTNESHHLIWQTTTIDPDHIYTGLQVTHGSWFWIHVSFSYLMLISGTGIIVHHLISASYLYRGQTGPILIGVVMPWAGNFFYVTNRNPLPGLDLTPFGFAFTGIAFAWSLYRHHFLDLIPIARNTVVEQLGDCVIVLDENNRIIDMNPAGQHIVGPEATDIIGCHASEVLASWYDDDFFNILTPDHAEIKVADTYYDLNITPIMSRRGRLTGRLVVLHNINVQKEKEFAMQSAKQSAEEAQRQAEEARAAAETAVRMKENFLMNMSHEIRTPLNAVVGMGTLLRDTVLTSEQQELVSTINTNADHLLYIINNMLDYSNLEAENLALENKPFDLHDCLQASLAVVASKARQKELELTYTVDENTPNTLTGDAVRLRQILINLLNNGIKFTATGVVSVDVSSHPLVDDRYELQFAVKDTGIGISPERMEMLFQTFTQADNSTTRPYSGVGLGLAISKRLCELMGGKIWAESDVEVGSTFYFTVVMAATQVEPSRFLSSEMPRLDGQRLLILTEDTRLRRKISQVTRSAGMKTYVAGSTSEALYWIEHSESFAALLLDAKMQDESFFSELRRRFTADHLPIIVLTAEADNQDNTLATNEPFAGYLSISFNTAHFYDVILDVLSRQSTGTNKRISPHKIMKMAEKHPLRILLTEDNQVNQKIVQGLLNKLGYEPDIANNGQECLDLLNQQAYDVVLMDIQMPVMDGVATTKHILSTWSPENRPRIVAITAHALEGNREQYLALGMDDYLSKPVQMNELINTLYRCQPVNGRQPPPVSFHTPTPITDQSSNPGIEASPQAHPIDLQELAMLVGTDVDIFLAEMTPLFIADADTLINTMQDAIERQDDEAIWRAAHTLKGTSASLAMKGLSGICLKLEKKAKRGDLPNRLSTLEELKKEYERVKVALPVRDIS